MRRLLLDLLLLGLVWALLYVLARQAVLAFGWLESPFLLGALFSLFLLSVAYGRIWNFKSSGGRLIALVIAFCIVLSGTSWLRSVQQRSFKLHSYYNNENRRGWSGRAHQNDSLLGFAPIRNARAWHTFPVGDPIPMGFSKDGFRIPLNADSLLVSDQPDILYLGCSFTYGDAMLAEETFAHVASKTLNKTYINAGVCSYGLSQMVLLAKQLLPKYRPDYVVVQHSPWLVERSLEPIAPVKYGTVFNPYFVEKDGSIRIEPPVSRSLIFDVDAERAKKESRMAWLWSEGLAFFIKQDLKALKHWIGGKDLSTAEAMDAARWGYEQIVSEAREVNSSVILLPLYESELPSYFQDLQDPDDVLVARPDSIMQAYLSSVPSGDFEKEFYHWRVDGADTIRVDTHPNKKAHQLIATSIAEVIQEYEHGISD